MHILIIGEIVFSYIAVYLKTNVILMNLELSACKVIINFVN